MNTTPLITVVIVNYNYGRYLVECLDSVFAQTYPNIEVIVVDDGSTDNSLSILQSYSDRILIVEQPNKGVSAARNVGLAKSSGQWIAFLDSDDSWRHNKLQEQFVYFRDPHVGMVFCGIEFTDSSEGCLGHTTPLTSSDYLSQFVTFTSPAIGGSAAVVRRDCLLDLGGFDEQLSTAADLNMWIRIAARYEIRAVPTALVKYRCHATSMHLNVPLFEYDNYRLLTSVFSDPSFAQLYHLRRRSFGRFYMILAGSYFQERHWGRAIHRAFVALLYSPLELTRLLGFPHRALRRLVERYL